MVNQSSHPLSLNEEMKEVQREMILCKINESKGFIAKFSKEFG